MNIHYPSEEEAKLAASIDMEELKRHLRFISYKPTWKFWINDAYPPRPLVLISFEAENTYRCGEIVKIGSSFNLKLPIVSLDQFDHMILSFIDSVEKHETREWFKIDGVKKFDPHKERNAKSS